MRYRSGLHTQLVSRPAAASNGGFAAAMALPLSALLSEFDLPRLDDSLIEELWRRLHRDEPLVDELWRRLERVFPLNGAERQARITDLRVGDRLWELDALRGLAISMMLGLHFLTVGTMAAPALGGLLALWKWLIVPACYIPIGAMLGKAVWRSPGLGLRQIDELAERSPEFKAALLAGHAALWVTMLSAVEAAGVGAEGFMWVMGLGLAVRHARVQARGLDRRARLQLHLKRGAGLFALGMGLTLFTWLLFPHSFVVFGILHLLGASIVLAAPFLELPTWVSFAGALIVLGAGLWVTPYLPSPGLWAAPLGLGWLGRVTLDYFPLFPWLGVTLLSAGAGRLLYVEGRRNFYLPDLSETRAVRVLSVLGRNSLKIYLLQAPFTFGGMGLLSPAE